MKWRGVFWKGTLQYFNKNYSRGSNALDIMLSTLLLASRDKKCCQSIFKSSWFIWFSRSLVNQGENDNNNNILVPTCGYKIIFIVILINRSIWRKTILTLQIHKALTLNIVFVTLPNITLINVSPCNKHSIILKDLFIFNVPTAYKNIVSHYH